MKINGKRVKPYRDKHGPYDAYWEKGCFISYIPKGTKVTKAFDYEGEHYGVISHDYNIKSALLFLCIPILILGVLAVVYLAPARNVECIVYRPSYPYRIDDTTVGLNITNMSEAPLYITIEDMRYTVNKGDTLDSVSLSSSNFTMVFEYENYRYSEVISL